ncbi:MAG: hypothetical protein CM15mP51_11640 [Porticoccaceae bacterium]|nr:MAG: hypothetical protein CM15mP51_11640 [Porticoccaceae bacterium]
MIKFVLLFFLIFPLHSFSDEARPVYIEIIENSETNLELKWKLPPVMLSVDEPSIELTVIDVVRMAIGLGLDYWAGPSILAINYREKLR